MKQPKSFREAEKMARLACSVENTMNTSRENSVAAQIGNLSQTVKSLLSAGVTPNAQSSTDDKKLLTVIEQNNALLANLSTALGNQGETTEPSRVNFTHQNNATTALAALNNKAFIEKSEFQELKNLLLEKLDSQNRHFDARIRGLARRNQGQREELPRQRTRDGQPLCFTCGRRGNFQASWPDRRNNAPRGPLPQQNRSQGVNYPPNYNYNQPRDNYRTYQQQNRRDQPLAALEEDYYDEHFVAELEQNVRDEQSFRPRPRSEPETFSD